MKRLKVLMLGSHDSKLAGQIQCEYMNMPDNVDAHMVTLRGLYGKAPHCFLPADGKGLTFGEKLKLFRFSGYYLKLWRIFYFLIKKRLCPIINKHHREYCFYGLEFVPYTAKDILEKCPKGFAPDLITIHWASKFITSKIVRELYEMTHASIAYLFVDEAPMTGGCHYPVDCMNYLNGCHDCPALLHGKRLAVIQVKYKEENLKEIPMYICGSPYDMRLAKKTNLFKNAIAIHSISHPQVTITNKAIARRKLGLNNDSFVVMIGASQLNDARKGINYSIEAINLAAQQISNLIVLVVGNGENSVLPERLKDVKVYELGFVDLDKLFLAFSAACCFLSTTIADSGPMMVNYSIAIGTPVISFPIGIAEDLVIHKKTGYLAKYKNVNDLKEGMLFLSTMGMEAQKQMSENCRQHIKEKATDWREELIKTCMLNKLEN
ncbi:MAG: glycosyltransferase [Prevotella sp.]|nr:glycosyltransferase [Prevotella sp.]